MGSGIRIFECHFLPASILWSSCGDRTNSIRFSMHDAAILPAMTVSDEIFPAADVAATDVGRVKPSHVRVVYATPCPFGALRMTVR